jgi:hypothetical protein
VFVSSPAWNDPAASEYLRHLSVFCLNPSLCSPYLLPETFCLNTMLLSI